MENDCPCAFVTMALDAVGVVFGLVGDNRDLLNRRAGSQRGTSRHSADLRSYNPELILAVPAIILLMHTKVSQPAAPAC